MKRWLMALLVALLLWGCGGDEEDGDGESGDDAQVDDTNPAADTTEDALGPDDTRGQYPEPSPSPLTFENTLERPTPSFYFWGSSVGTSASVLVTNVGDIDQEVQLTADGHSPVKRCYFTNELAVIQSEVATSSTPATYTLTPGEDVIAECWLSEDLDRADNPGEVDPTDCAPWRFEDPEVEQGCERFPLDFTQTPCGIVRIRYGDSDTNWCREMLIEVDPCGPLDCR